MAEDRKSHNTDCTSESHREHLCYIYCHRLHDIDDEEFEKMLKDAEYLCRACDRMAKEKENLCEPMKL
jgi:hypothetical protein